MKVSVYLFVALIMRSVVLGADLPTGTLDLELNDRGISKETIGETFDGGERQLHRYHRKHHHRQ